MNVASRTFFTGSPGQLAYVASKGGVFGHHPCARQGARRARHHGQRGDALAGRDPRYRGALGPEMFESTMREQIIKEFVRPEDFAPIVAFLASDDGRMITGQSIVCATAAACSTEAPRRTRAVSLLRRAARSYGGHASEPVTHRRGGAVRPRDHRSICSIHVLRVRLPTRSELPPRPGGAHHRSSQPTGFRGARAWRSCSSRSAPGPQQRQEDDAAA